MAEHRSKTDLHTDRVKKHLDEVRPLASAWHSSEEGKEWHRQHVAESLGKIEPVKLVCQQCGNTFLAKNNYAKFCSHNCSVKWDYEHKKRTELRLCVVCGAEFTAVITTRHGGAQTCSRSCAFKLRARGKDTKESL